MKKLLLVLFISVTVYSQNYTVKDKNGNTIGTIQEKKPIGWDYMAGSKAAAEGAKIAADKNAAAAASRNATQQLIINRAAAMSDPSSIIKTPLQVDLNNFTTIALVGIGNIGGLYGPKASYKWVHKALEFSPLKVINPLKENKKKYKKNKMFLRDTKDPNWLYIYVKFSMSGVNSTKSLTIRDSKNKVLYSASHTNSSIPEVMSVLTDF